MLTAIEIMTDQVVTVQPDASIQDAIELLLEEEISGLPVIDEAGALIGIVTEYALLAIAYEDKIRDEKISDHMTTELLTVDLNDPIRKIADVFILHRVRRVPVVDNGRLVGLIARRDVLKALNCANSTSCTA